MGETKASAALLIIDMINPLDFPGAAPLRAAVDDILKPLLALRAAADEAGLPVVYVNDHHGAWHAEPSQLIEKVVRAGCPGGAIAERLRPRENDYFVIKPQVSGFYATTLPALLPRLGVDRLILSGVAADICVLFTAADAHMREYDLWAPRDVVAGEDERRTSWALEIMRNSFGAETCATADLDLPVWLARSQTSG